MWTNDKYLSGQLSIIPYCDFLLCNGHDEIVGFYFQEGKMNKPQIKLFCNYSDSYIIKIFAYEYGVPCYEDKILTHSIARKINNDRDYDDKFVNRLKDYYKYATLKKFYYFDESQSLIYQKINIEEFCNELNRDVLHQLYRVEEHWYKKYSRKAFKKLECLPVLKGLDAEVCIKQFVNKLHELSNENNMTIYDEKKFFSHEIVIKKNNDYWASKNFYVFISESGKFLEICNRYLSVFFNLNEYIQALCWLKSVLNEDLKKQIKDIEKFKSKLFINQKNYDLAHKLIFSLIENKIKPAENVHCVYEDKVYAKFFIKKDERKKYEVLIAYNRFNSNPKEFSDFLDKPFVFDDWDFWCKESRIKKGDFEENNKS